MITTSDTLQITCFTRFTWLHVTQKSSGNIDILQNFVNE